MYNNFIISLTVTFKVVVRPIDAHHRAQEFVRLTTQRKLH